MNALIQKGDAIMQYDKHGMVAAFIAYVLWGLFPLYWKALAHVDSTEILASRVIWSFMLTLLFVFVLRKGHQLVRDVKELWQHQKTFWTLAGAAYLVTFNWFLYIWAVNNNHILETSLGYYLNPIISILLGIIFLKERLAKAQILGVVIALIGVVIMIANYGAMPYVAFGLALSFGFYGLLKKRIQLDAIRGLVIETAFVLPVALLYYAYLASEGKMSFGMVDLKTTVLLIGGGAVTAIPLILFAVGAQKIPLYLVGFIQYVAPTMTLLLGVFVYGETFGPVEMISFSFIWIALIIFSVSTIVEVRKQH